MNIYDSSALTVVNIYPYEVIQGHLPIFAPFCCIFLGDIYIFIYSFYSFHLFVFVN